MAERSEGTAVSYVDTAVDAIWDAVQAAYESGYQQGHRDGYKDAQQAFYGKDAPHDIAG